MIKLWSRNRPARSVVPAQQQPGDGADDQHSLPYGPYASVTVSGDALPQSGFGSLVATRSFDDPDEAKQVQTAWQRHAPHLTVRLSYPIRSSAEPNYEGAYFLDGTWHTGQPAEIDALVEIVIAESAERAAQRAREKERRELRLAALAAELEARRPKQVVVAEAGDGFLGHHDKFLKATQCFVEGRPVDQPRFQFAPFTGREPKPVLPVTSALCHTKLEREFLLLIRAEYAEALKLWTAAAYRHQAESALRDAAAAWPTVAAAFDRIEQAWADLDHPPHGWEAAVKQLLDAHDAAARPVSGWEDIHAPRLVTLGADLVDSQFDLEVLRDQVGTELGIAGIQDWLVGRAGERCGNGRYIEFAGGAGQHLDDLVSTQRARLADIVNAAGRPATT